MACVMPFTKMLPTLLPSVKPEHYGVVGGIQATFQNFGMFLLASYVISPIAIAATGAVDGVVYYQGVYVATAVLCVIAGLSLFLFPNVRSSVAGKIADDRAAMGEGEAAPAAGHGGRRGAGQELRDVCRDRRALAGAATVLRQAAEAALRVPPPCARPCERAGIGMRFARHAARAAIGHLEPGAGSHSAPGRV